MGRDHLITVIKDLRQDKSTQLLKKDRNQIPPPPEPKGEEPPAPPPEAQIAETPGPTSGCCRDGRSPRGPPERSRKYPPRQFRSRLPDLPVAPPLQPECEAPAAPPPEVQIEESSPSPPAAPPMAESPAGEISEIQEFSPEEAPGPPTRGADCRNSASRHRCSADGRSPGAFPCRGPRKSPLTGFAYASELPVPPASEPEMQEPVDTAPEAWIEEGMAPPRDGRTGRAPAFRRARSYQDLPIAAHYEESAVIGLPSLPAAEPEQNPRSAIYRASGAANPGSPLEEAARGAYWRDSGDDATTVSGTEQRPTRSSSSEATPGEPALPQIPKAPNPRPLERSRRSRQLRHFRRNNRKHLCFHHPRGFREETMRSGPEFSEPPGGEPVARPVSAELRVPPEARTGRFSDRGYY